MNEESGLFEKTFAFLFVSLCLVVPSIIVIELIGVVYASLK